MSRMIWKQLNYKGNSCLRKKTKTAIQYFIHRQFFGGKPPAKFNRLCMAQIRQCDVRGATNFVFDIPDCLPVSGEIKCTQLRLLPYNHGSITIAFQRGFAARIPVSVVMTQVFSAKKPVSVHRHKSSPQHSLSPESKASDHALAIRMDLPVWSIS